VKCRSDEPIAKRLLPDGREATIWVRMFNTIICVGRSGVLHYDDQW